MMSLFGNLAGQVLGSVLGGKGGAPGNQVLLQVAMSLLQQHGGIEGLLAKLRNGGLGAQAASWVGTGQNQAINAADLGKALGQDSLSALAGKFGLAPDVLGNGLAEVLPQLIDKATPQGSTQGADALLQQGLSVLGELLGKR